MRAPVIGSRWLVRSGLCGSAACWRRGLVGCWVALQGTDRWRLRGISLICRLLST
jgi:hypothetical protein